MFFCLGVLKIEDGTLETIATSMWGKGLTISKELALQKVDFQFGASFLILSFLVQLVGKCLPPEVAPLLVTSSIPYGVALGLGMPLVTVGVLLIPYCQLRTRVIKRLSEAVAGKV
jgi:hypothetical protein